MICRMHFPNGTLTDFLRTRIQHMSEISLHKVSLDVANGLEFLHQRNLVHNGLNSNTVFMASVSEVMTFRKNNFKFFVHNMCKVAVSKNYLKHSRTAQSQLLKTFLDTQKSFVSILKYIYVSKRCFFF